VTDTQAATPAPDATAPARKASVPLGDDSPGRAGAASASAEQLLVQEGDIAGDYLERLLDIADVDGDIDMDVENSRAVVAIVGAGLDALVGPGGTVLDALQELTRLAVVQQTGVRSRLMLDIGGWRAQRKIELSQTGVRAAERVLASGQPVSLAPMTPFERKIVHDAVAGVDGVVSESEGVEPERRVVLLPAGA